jgi:hypothetical protein
MLGFVYWNSELLARSQFVSGWFCDRPTWSMFSMLSLDPREKAKSVENSSLPNALPSFRRTSSRRTNGNFQCRTVFPPPEYMSHPTHKTLSLLFSSLLRDLMGWPFFLATVRTDWKLQLKCFVFVVEKCVQVNFTLKGIVVSAFLYSNHLSDYVHLKTLYQLICYWWISLGE